MTSATMADVKMELAATNNHTKKYLKEHVANIGEQTLDDG